MPPKSPTTNVTLPSNATLQLEGKDYSYTIIKKLAKTLHGDVYAITPNKPSSFTNSKGPKIIKGFNHLTSSEIVNLDQMTQDAGEKEKNTAETLDEYLKAEAKALKFLFQGRSVTSLSPSPSRWVKMKYYSSVTLDEWIRTNTFNPLNFLTIALSLCYELAVLHELGIHGDIKPLNITVNSINIAHLIDFGAFTPNTRLIAVYGSPGFIDNPAANRTKAHSNKDDMLAFAITLIQLFLMLDNDKRYTLLINFISEKILKSTNQNQIINYFKENLTRENILNALTEKVNANNYTSNTFAIYSLLHDIARKPEDQRLSARELLKLLFQCYQDTTLVPVNSRLPLLMTCVGNFLARKEYGFHEAKRAFDKSNLHIKKLKNAIDTLSKELHALSATLPEVKQFIGNVTPISFNATPTTLMALRTQISNLSPFYRTHEINDKMHRRFLQLLEGILAVIKKSPELSLNNYPYLEQLITCANSFAPNHFDDYKKTILAFFINYLNGKLVDSDSMTSFPYPEQTSNNHELAMAMILPEKPLIYALHQHCFIPALRHEVKRYVALYLQSTLTQFVLLTWAQLTTNNIADLETELVDQLVKHLNDHFEKMEYPSDGFKPYRLIPFEKMDEYKNTFRESLIPVTLKAMIHPPTPLPILMRQGKLSVKSIDREVRSHLEKIINSDDSPYKYEAYVKLCLIKHYAPIITYQVKNFLDSMPIPVRLLKFSIDTAPTSVYNNHMFWSVLKAQTTKNEISSEPFWKKQLSRFRP